MLKRLWQIPEGLRVLRDGTWRTGDLPVAHGPILRYLKERLVFEDGVAFVVDGDRRMPVLVEGPPFEVTALRLDRAAGRAEAVLDDGSVERLREDSLGMDDETGRFQCAVRGGRARALLSRGAHQALLDNADEEGGRFYLRVGPVRIPIRT